LKEVADFESMVSPTQVREHKKSIDEQFEQLLMDDNNNSPASSTEVFKSLETAKDQKTVPAKDKPEAVASTQEARNVFTSL